MRTTSTVGDEFPDVVASEFAFLLGRGFVCTVETDASVYYEGPNEVFVRVFRDPVDWYVGFRVGLTRRPKDALTATEPAQLTGAALEGDYPETSSELRASAARLARLLKDNGERVLTGDEAVLDEAMVLRRRYTERFTQSLLQSRAGPRVVRSEARRVTVRATERRFRARLRARDRSEPIDDGAGETQRREEGEWVPGEARP